MRRRHDNWTPAQDDAIRTLGPLTGSDDALLQLMWAIRPGLSLGSLRVRRRLLGILKQRGGAHVECREMLPERKCTSCRNPFQPKVKRRNRVLVDQRLCDSCAGKANRAA